MKLLTQHYSSFLDTKELEEKNKGKKIKANKTIAAPPSLHYSIDCRNRYLAVFKSLTLRFNQCID